LVLIIPPPLRYMCCEVREKQAGLCAPAYTLNINLLV